MWKSADPCPSLSSSSERGSAARSCVAVYNRPVLLGGILAYAICGTGSKHLTARELKRVAPKRTNSEIAELPTRVFKK